MLLLCFLLLINVGIAYWNAMICGSAWDEATAEGGWSKILVWGGAFQSVVGFSSAYIFAFAMIVGGTYGHAALSLWYLIAIIPAIGTGLVITVHSWITAWRERDLASIATSVWNTGASIHNISSAGSGISDAFSVVGDFFGGSSNDDDAGSALGKLGLIICVFLLLAASVGTTYVIMQKYRGTLRAAAA